MTPMDIDWQRVIALVKEMKPTVMDREMGTDYIAKAPGDFVTMVDLRVSTDLARRLMALYPDISFVSEEGSADRSMPDPCWILDPIDGTTNLVFDLQTSSVSLALYVGGEIVFGVVYDPYREETFHAIKGRGAYLNGRPMERVPCRTLDQGLVEFGAGYTEKENSVPSFELAREVFSAALDVRRMCSTALAVCYIAAGRLDGYFEHKIKPWDHAAAGLILRECGGVATDWNGDPLSYEKTGTILCGNPAAHKELLEIISRHKDRFI